jgi:L-rhamnose mutarotase
MSKRYALAVDLVDDPILITEYEQHHTKVWPEILASIKNAGITDMEIYRLGNRLFMIMDVDGTFSFEKKAAADSSNAKVQEWEDLMWKYQQALPLAVKGEKWMLMKNIFKLRDQL